MLLTDRKIRAAKAGKLSEPAPRGNGRLLVRIRDGGRREFFFRSRAGGADTLRKLGDYGAMSLAEARERVRTLSRDPTAASARGTLGDLLSAYVDDLEARGKRSARDAKNAFLRALPERDALRRKRAAEIRPADITAVIARRIKAGAGTEANRLRSMLHAAFALGARLDHDPRAAARQSPRFGLTGNPVSVVQRIAEFERTRDRVLSWSELGAYWRELDAEPVPVAASLRLILAIGGQRMQQVLRASWEDIAEHVVPSLKPRRRSRRIRALRIVDAKGRGEAREHLVPLSALAEEQLAILATSMKRRGAAPDAKGEKPPRPFMVDHFRLGEAISAASKALGGERFDARDLRRSVETRLADLGVGRETLAHLLSHGRSGVQARHYDRAMRLPEKLAALELWDRHLRVAISRKRAPRNVVAMPRRATS